jgi:hypothetical protein
MMNINLAIAANPANSANPAALGAFFLIFDCTAVKPAKQFKIKYLQDTPSQRYRISTPVHL